MSLELVDITLAERQPHPRLQDRVNGKVRAILVETLGELEYRHEIDVPVWIDRKSGMGDEDLELALLVKAAGIVSRIKAQFATPSAP